MRTDTSASFASLPRESGERLERAQHRRILRDVIGRMPQEFRYLDKGLALLAQYGRSGSGRTGVAARAAVGIDGESHAGSIAAPSLLETYQAQAHRPSARELVALEVPQDMHPVAGSQLLRALAELAHRIERDGFERLVGEGFVPAMDVHAQMLP